jgi:hypothetical protein
VKVSAKRFAELAGCSAERVMRYYKAWDRAADDGMVPHFEALAPGAEIDLPDSDVWLSYYSSRSSATSDRGTAITAAAEAERHLSLIDELDDDEDTGEWATEAYDTVKELVVQTVESNPELRVQERRTKFYSSLQKATKVFEELTLDDAMDLDAIYEDDMLQRLEELQEALTPCIAALRKASPGD